MNIFQIERVQTINREDILQKVKNNKQVLSQTNKNKWWTQINNIRDETEDLTTCTSEIQDSIKECF